MRRESSSEGAAPYVKEGRHTPWVCESAATKCFRTLECCCGRCKVPGHLSSALTPEFCSCIDSTRLADDQVACSGSPSNGMTHRSCGTNVVVSSPRRPPAASVSLMALIVAACPYIALISASMLNHPVTVAAIIRLGSATSRRGSRSGTSLEEGRCVSAATCPMPPSLSPRRLS